MTKSSLLLVLAIGSLSSVGRAGETAKPSAVADIEALNQRLTQAIVKMDNAALLALWADDGISLLPGVAPMVGKSTIAAELKKITDSMAGYRVLAQEDDCHDIEVWGERASEWCYTHQTVQPPHGKPKLEIWGKMLLLLRRDKDGPWRITREMWNQGLKR